MMTLIQALGHIKERAEIKKLRKIFLACGFQPLHLQTFLQAYFAERFPEEAADIETGLYGDLDRTLVAAAQSQADAAVFILEAVDLDPRLGLRSAGGWALSLQADILESVRHRLSQLIVRLQDLAANMPVALVAPTLPFTLAGHTVGWQLSSFEAELHQQIASFLATATRISGVAVLNAWALAQASPALSRSDPFMEFKVGFPYTLSHASAVASQAIRLLFPPAPMKGLITDLDDTFWAGIVGEIGPEGVTWSLAEHTQIHALYQQMLAHLAEMGVLLAIASKNELAVVEQALQREDLLVPADAFFPIHANWGPKSASVAEILRTWNIGADSVVFVDDSAIELDEVRSAFPQVTCLQFSRKQATKTVELIERLRDLFGKPSIQQEDTLRQASIRANSALQAEAAAAPGGDFLRGLQGKVSFDLRKDPGITRILELINKTNQFNLNGLRVSDAEWRRHLEDPASVIMAVSYDDKFGPLGVIGVLSGRHMHNEVQVTSWVLSCRAFSRQIEHHMLDQLFALPGVDTVRLDFQPTARNQPLQNHLISLGLDIGAAGSISLSQQQFRNQVEVLPHSVRLRES